MTFRLHDPDELAVDFEQVIISVILLSVLFANQTRICSTSAAHVSLVLYWLLNTSALAADFKQVIIPVFFIWHCLLTRHWFVKYQQNLYIGVILQYNSGSVAADFKQLIVLYAYFSLGYFVFTSF